MDADASGQMRVSKALFQDTGSGQKGNLDGTTLREHYLALLTQWQAAIDSDSPLPGAVAHFGKVTASYAPGLFHCYDVADLPRTNNALEQSFGSVRAHERRATGRRGAVPGLAVRGSVRISASLLTPT